MNVFVWWAVLFMFNVFILCAALIALINPVITLFILIRCVLDIVVLVIMFSKLME